MGGIVERRGQELRERASEGCRDGVFRSERSRICAGTARAPLRVHQPSTIRARRFGKGRQVGCLREESFSAPWSCGLRPLSMRRSTGFETVALYLSHRIVISCGEREKNGFRSLPVQSSRSPT